MSKIDLHMHSTASDGSLSPKELIDLAIRKKIPAISITDHDTTAGNNEAIEYAKTKNIEFVTGIEITITPPEDCKELHLVGLFINSNNNKIKNIQTKNRKRVEEVIKKIIRKLNQLGYEITFEELLNETDEKQLGRPFIARILMRKYPKEFPNRKDVFNKLLGKSGKAFVRPKGTPLKEAIKMIHNAGGIAIIAHPWYLGDQMEKIVETFSNLGGDGIEISYTPKESIPKNMKKRLIKISEEKNLITSGGTDFHEMKKNEKEIGENGLSFREFRALKEYHKKKFGNSY